MFDKSIKELQIPSPGGAKATSFFCAVIVVFSLLASGNLLLWGASIVVRVCSFLWLVFVTLIVWSGISTQGSIRRFVIGLLSPFARHHFIVVQTDESGTDAISLGFYLHGIHILHGPIQLEGIETLGWSTGQASALGGKDMDDWHVVLWFRTDAKHADGRRSNRDRDLICIGPSGPRSRIEPIGHSIADWLYGLGIEWQVTEDKQRGYQLRRKEEKTDG